MKRRMAVYNCWELVNKNKYKEAGELMNKQRRIHGNRLFSYWLRLTIVNGIWEQSLEHK